MPAAKIITKLRERRQIEADLQEMLSAGSDLEFRRRAQQIAALGSQVIPALVGNLDRADGQMLVAMGTVAAFLDREEVTAALRRAALHPGRTDKGRIGAMTILERFLGQPPDDDLLSSLNDPEGVALSSLDEVLDQMERNPAVLIQYVEELDQQEPDVVLAVARTLRGGEMHRRAVEPLRLMAQDVRDEIAAEALEGLGIIRLPEAARALQTLIPIVAPDLRPPAERLLRKLRFSGVRVAPLPRPDPAWRALVSPVNGLGQQSVWFILENRETAYARFLNVLVSDRAGAIEAVGHNQVLSQMLPPLRPAGHLHDIAMPDGSGAMLMLETDFNLGRRLVLDALADNRETQIPVAGPLRLLSPWLWGAAGADSLPTVALPERPAEPEKLVAVSDQLVGHPAFATWSARSEATFQAAEEALRHPRWDLEVWVRRLAGDLFGEPMVAGVFSQRLAAMSEWLCLAGDEKRAAMALAAAEAMLQKPPQEQPFLRAIIRRDLEFALEGLRAAGEGG